MATKVKNFTTVKPYSTISYRNNKIKGNFLEKMSEV